MPQICKYWQINQCKFGGEKSAISTGSFWLTSQVACRFDHPLNDGSILQHNNPFTVLQNKANSDSRNPNKPDYEHPTTDKSRYTYDKETIICDLTVEKPQWVLSAYAPGRQIPAQLFGGYPREQSFEEIRLLHYMASSDPQMLEQTILSTEKLVKDSEQQIQHSLQNLDDAIKYLTEAANHHPNRVDICRQSESRGVPTAPTTTQNPNLFQVAPNHTHFTSQSDLKSPINASTFGKPSVPVFGAPTAPTGIFGQPSTLGHRVNPFAAVRTTFGVPSQPAKPNQNSFSSNPSTGLANTNPNPFAQAASNPPVNKLHTSEPSSRQNPFESSSIQAFGAPSFSFETQKNSKTDIATQLNPVPRPSSLNPFAVLSNDPKSNSVVSNLKNPFANPAESHINPSNTSKNMSDKIEPNAFNSIKTSFQGGAPVHRSDNQALKSQTPNGLQKDLKSLRNRDVEYRDKIPGFINDEGVWEKIWFPDGKPEFSEDAKMPAETAYDEVTSKAYSYARQNKRFENGCIPALPPKDIWCGFDF